MEYETAGDPMSNLKWTRKTTENISNELSSLNIHVSKTTVGKLLKKMGFSLKTNVKKISNGGKKVSKREQEERNLQFKYINEKRKVFVNNNLPVISVDCKKKELIGNFKNPGIRYRKEVDLVNDHDFTSYAVGKAIPFGVYDESFNMGTVYVGQQLWNGKRLISSDTPEFAVECIEKWWKSFGINNYPKTKEILILADAGGSNGYRPHMWKHKIQELLCNKYGLKVTICHYYPGSSKWNPIEHRLFSEISKNLQGVPLKDYNTILRYIRTTKTKTGLKVNAELITKEYKKGINVSKNNIENLKINRHEFLAKLNYTINPKR